MHGKRCGVGSDERQMTQVLRCRTRARNSASAWRLTVLSGHRRVALAPSYGTTSSPRSCTLKTMKLRIMFWQKSMRLRLISKKNMRIDGSIWGPMTRSACPFISGSCMNMYSAGCVGPTQAFCSNGERFPKELTRHSRHPLVSAHHLKPRERSSKWRIISLSWHWSTFYWTAGSQNTSGYFKSYPKCIARCTSGRRIQSDPLPC
mmetsp:Transcript_5432/g.12473  ORF Transcript_5432/g.12473 Transcript_5432/m.12473 type:complete len:204 (-) Transcript_5432:571-1182(-)